MMSPELPQREGWVLIHLTRLGFTQVCNLNSMFYMVDYVVNGTKRYYPNKLWVQLSAAISARAATSGNSIGANMDAG